MRNAYQVSGRQAWIVWSALLVVLTASRLAAGQTVYSPAVGFQRLSPGEGRSFVAAPFENNPSTLSGMLPTNQLPAGSVQSFATTVDIWNQEAQTLTNRYWLSSAAGFGGWLQANTFVDANDVVLDRRKGLILTVRAGEGTQTLVLKGVVSTGAMEQVLAGNGKYNLVASTFPAPLTLDDSGLVESGLQGGDSLDTADNLLFFNPATQRFDEKVFYDDVARVWWNADITIATRQIEPGEAFLIRRMAVADMVWTSHPPYTLP